MFGKIMRFPAAQTEYEMHVLSAGDKIVWLSDWRN